MLLRQSVFDSFLFLLGIKFIRNNTTVIGTHGDGGKRFDSQKKGTVKSMDNLKEQISSEESSSADKKRGGLFSRISEGLDSAREARAGNRHAPGDGPV